MQIGGVKFNRSFAVFCGCPFRYRRILKAVEENIDVPPSIVPALKQDQEGMLAPKVPLNTSPELVMFCYRVYEFRFKRMKNFY